MLQVLVAFYGLLWIMTAIAPRQRFDWFLENILVFILVAVLAATYRRFPFSDLSYLLITAFLSLHTIGAHYTYSEVPLGFWIQEALGLGRNHYDRILHFSFGLLMAYPVREIFLRAAGLRAVLGYAVAFTSILTFSASYEVAEWIVAMIVSPETALAYLGTQGDVFDAQKDMGLAIAGAAMGLGLTAILEKVLAKDRSAGAGRARRLTARGQG